MTTKTRQLNNHIISTIKNISVPSATSLVEVLVAISLISLLIIIFSASYFIVDTNRFLRNKNLAYNLALEEIEALRSSPFDIITNRTNDNFIEIAHNLGTGIVQNHANAPSSPNVFYQSPLPNSSPGITSVTIIPGFDYENHTVETKLKIDNSSPANWQAGICIRYHDIDNYYLIYLNSTNLVITKNVAGSSSILATKSKSFLKNTWYTLKVEATSNTFNLYINGTLEQTTTDPQSSISKGRAALVGINSTISYFDDLSITTTATKSWNFDTDTVGVMPTFWQRFGINDLPEGQEKLTIADVNNPDLKKVTATVSWRERGFAKEVSIITNIAK